MIEEFDLKINIFLVSDLKGSCEIYLYFAQFKKMVLWNCENI